MVIECREYFLQNVHTSHYLKNCKNLHNVCAYPEKNDSEWVLNNKDTIFFLQIKESCLDINNNYNTLYLNKCNNTTTQEWVLMKIDDFVFKILNVEERCFISSDLHGNVFCTFITKNSYIPDNKWFIF
jgi:hypothetical protein